MSTHTEKLVAAILAADNQIYVITSKSVCGFYGVGTITTTHAYKVGDKYYDKYGREHSLECSAKI